MYLGDKSKGCGFIFLAAAAVIIIITVLSGFGWSILIIVGAVIAIITGLLFALNSYYKKKTQETVADGVTNGGLSDAMDDIRKKLSEINRHYYNVDNDYMQQNLDDISDKTRKLLSLMKEKPGESRSTRRFLNITLDACEKMVSKYVILLNAPELDEKGREVMAVVPDRINDVSKSFDKQIRMMYDDDVMDLDVELEVLKRSLKSLGFEDEEDKIR